MLRYALTAWALGGALCVPATAQTVEEENRDAVRAPAAGKEAPELARAAERIVAQNNAFRKDEQRKTVTANENLTATARYFADYMARTDEYGHTADGKQPSQRTKEHGYDYCIVAENIAEAFDSRGFTTEKLADTFTTGWKNSPEHRKNMLDPDVTETGVAVARSAKTGYYYAVQMFGRPKALALTFDIGNDSDEAVRYTLGGRTFELPPRVTRTHTRCRPAEAKFQWPGADEPQTAITPANGDRFVVTRTGKQFSVKKK